MWVYANGLIVTEDLDRAPSAGANAHGQHRLRQGWLSHTRKTLAELPKRVDHAKLSPDGKVDFSIF